MSAVILWILFGTSTTQHKETKQVSTAKAIIYTRVSTGRQAEEGTSLEVQEAACLRQAKTLGAEVIDVIADEGVSGALYLSRPGIQRALSLIESGAANILITMKLDRSGRDVDALRLIRRRVMEAGGQLLFTDGMSFENTAIGNLMFTQISGFAEYEKEIIRERTVSGRIKRAKEGKQPARALSPYGYHVVNQTDVLRGEYPPDTIGTYIVIEEQSQWVREIYSLYANGLSMRQIARRLDEKGVPTARGGKGWSMPTIRNILTHPVYKGVAVFGRYQRKVDEGRLQKYDVRQHGNIRHPNYYVMRNAEDWLEIPAPSLVSVEMWDICQQKIKGNKDMLSGNPTRKHFLSGLIRCPQCNNLMRANTNVGSGHVYYHCKKAWGNRLHGQTCHTLQYRADRTDPLIIYALMEVAKSPALFDIAIKAYNQAIKRVDTTSQTIAHIRSLLDQLTAEERATITAQIEGIKAGASPTAYGEVFANIRTQRTSLETRLEEFTTWSSHEERTVPASLAARYAEMIDDVSEALNAPELTPAERRQVILPLVDYIVPDEKGFRVYLHRTQPILPESSEYGIQMFFTCVASRRNRVISALPEKYQESLYTQCVQVRFMFSADSTSILRAPSPFPQYQTDATSS